MRRYLPTPGLPTSKTRFNPENPKNLPQSLFRMLSFLLGILFLATPVALHGQTGAASITGRINDGSGAAIQDADVAITNTATKVILQTKSNKSGVYSFPNLNPGNYVMRVERNGFRSEDVVGLSIYTNDNLEKNFVLQIGSVSESVTVQGGTTSTAPGISMTVSRDFIANMPLNGQSLQDLIQLAPGTVNDGQGYFYVDGQRTDSNISTVDGVSVNIGGINQGAGNVGISLSGYSSAQTVLGTTQSISSIDSLQEFKIQTSGYGAEYGRSPGGQIQYTTRSGSNNIHGTLSEYLRNTALDANSYNNDYYGYPQTAEHQNDFGGTVGGPVVIPHIYNGKDRTFYFFSYEGLRLLLPTSESEYVPTPAFRSWASPNVQPFLNAVPLPNASTANNDGCTITDTTNGLPTACDAQFYAAYSYPSRINATSFRVDESFNSRVHGFIRYSDTPSSESSGIETLSLETANLHTWTAGLTADLTAALLNDLRFNYSRMGEVNLQTENAEAGAVPFDKQLVVPSQYTSDPFSSGEAIIYVPGSSLLTEPAFGGAGSIERQYQILDSFTWSHANHSIKFGADWRRLATTYQDVPYQNLIEVLDLQDIQAGYDSAGTVSSHGEVTPIFDNLSLYVQDHWALSPHFSMDYGLRWEFNPPPGAANGLYPLAFTSSDLATNSIAPLGTEIYKSTYNHFAPRLGFAWQPPFISIASLTLRGGFGIFFDTGQNVAGEAYQDGYPFAASKSLSEVPLPLTSANLTAPPLNPTLTYPYVLDGAYISPNLTLPYTEEWNLSLDHKINAHNTLTLSYIGNVGRKLIYTESLSGDPYSNPNLSQSSYLLLASNGSQSNYHAFQIQDVGKIGVGLNVVGSFTYAHSLDNASQDYSLISPQYGNSDYDLRRVLNLALNYQIPGSMSQRWMRGLTNGWLLSNRFSAQSGIPLNIVQSYVFPSTIAGSLETEYFPNLVPHVPIYLHGKAADLDGQPVPASWRLNPAAFACTPTGATSPCSGTPREQGDLGRNYVRNPSFWALNTALERSFPFFEQLQLALRVDAFNLFNHPNPQLPDTSLTDPNFGVLDRGVITAIGTPNSLYGMGTARSLQVSLKLTF